MLSSALDRSSVTFRSEDLWSFSVEVVGNRTNVKVSWPPFFVGDDPSGGSTGDAAASPSARTKIFERLYFEHCGETTDQIRMPFGIIGRTGPGIRQGLGIGPREGVLLGANLGRAIVTNGYFTAYVYTFAATRPSSQITLGLCKILKRLCVTCKILWMLCVRVR